MAYTPYYAPYYRPMNYYNPSFPQEQNMQSGQQMPIQQQMQPPVQMPMQPTQMTVTNDMIGVLSQVEAESYPVAINNSATLWDKNNDTVYIKSVNAQGVPSMRILDYVERTPDNTPKTPDKHVCTCGKEFVRKEDFEALQSKFATLWAKVDELTAIPAPTKAKTNAKEEAE